MASYTNRWSEIEKAFDDVYKAAMAKKNPDDIVLAQRLRIESTLHRYVEFRNKALDEFIKMLSGFSSSLTEKNQGERWKDEVSKRGQEAFKMISDLDDNDESELNVFVLAVATQEADFFHKIASMEYGAFYGFLNECASTLYEERKNLGGKWSSTESSAKSLNERSEQAGKQMLEAFKEAAAELGKANRRAAEAVASTLLLYKKYQDAKTGNEPGLPDVFEDSGNRVKSLTSTAEDVARLYEDAYKSKETTLVLFGNNRTAVREFLEKTNLEKAKKRGEEVQKDAASQASAMLTKGQRDDALVFINEANNAIKGPLENYEKGFNDFVTEYKGIFIGPVGNNTLDKLLRGEFWDNTEDGLKRLNFESELKRYYDEAEDMWNIPLDGLDDTLKSAFKEQFKNELRKYDEEVEKAIVTYTRIFKSFYIDYPISKLKEMLSRSKGWED